MAALIVAVGAFVARAVDGLQIQVHEGTNVMLYWPSVLGQTYVIVQTTNLSEPVLWNVLESGYAAAESTNETTFIHYDQIPAVLGGGGDSAAGSGDNPAESKAWQGPMVMQVDFKTGLVPLDLYPPGLDLSGRIIVWPDGSTQEWSEEFAEKYAAFKAENSGDPQTEDSGGDSSPVSCGFYRVLGVKLLGGITNNSTLSDYFTVTARPEFGVKYLRLLVDGQGFPGQSALLPPFTNTIAFEWVDSARMSNGGPYNIQVEAVYQVESPHSEGIHHTLSQPVQVSVFNELSFPNWDDATEDEVCGFDIVSAHPVVDWEIDVYNIYDYIAWLEGQIPDIWPIHVQTGSTTNGIIQYDWNYLDDFGVWRTNIWDDPYFVSFTYTEWTSGSQSSGGGGPGPLDSGGSAATMNPLKRQPPKWPPQGHWVVAWQDMFRHYYDANNYLRSAFTSIKNMANLPESDVPAAPPFWQPPIGGTNAQTFPIRFFYNQFRTDLNPTNSDFYQSTLNDQRLFELMLRDSRARNLFYYGHSSPEWIASSVYAALLRDYGMHRYRFVWLDGCETSEGTWPNTFNIPGPGTYAIEYYKERTKRPALFVGNKYSVPIGIPRENYKVGGVKYDGEIPRSVSEVYNQFIYFWQLLGREYKVALNDAQTLVKAAYPNPVMHYVGGAKDGQVYWPGDDQVRVGYEEMRFNAYNKYYDIPRP